MVNPFLKGDTYFKINLNGKLNIYLRSERVYLCSYHFLLQYNEHVFVHTVYVHGVCSN